MATIKVPTYNPMVLLPTKEGMSIPVDKGNYWELETDSNKAAKWNGFSPTQKKNVYDKTMKERRDIRSHL